MKKSVWTSDKSLLLSRALTAATLVLGVASLFCIPIITEWYDAISEQEPIRNVLTVCLYLSAVLGLTALGAVWRMLANIAKQDVFVPENVSCFRMISWCCFAVAAIWLVLTFWRLLAFFVAFMAAFAGLILRVMKNLFAQAVEMREENDYTI